jgi:tRNA G18 (ribose-2'-O)-methylase SpoU
VPIVPISNPADPRLDDYRNIPDPALIEQHHIFVAEGRLVVRRLLTESRLTTRSLLLTGTALDSLSDLISSRPELPVFVVSQDVMDAMTGFNIHRGCLAIGERPVARRPQDVIRDTARLVVLERIANADNVGGIFRNAAAFAADAVLLGPGCTDPLYRKAIRTSMGAALIVPFAEVDEWPAALHDLRAAGVSVIALTPAASAATLHECAGQLHGRRAAVVVGHEGDGLSTGTLEACDVHARIPMAPGVDSLNVATAVGIALYELRRER